MALDTDDWLVWLGIKQPQQSTNSMDGDVERLKEQVGDYEAFQEFVDGEDGFDAYKTALDDAGFSTENAENHVERVQNNYDDWSTYAEYVQGATTYEQYKSGFGTITGMSSEKTTEDGEPVAGIRVHDQAGISYSGQSLPAGTTEIFGRRIEFSQQDAAVEAEDLSWSNLQTDDEDNVVYRLNEITVSADATNPNQYGVDVTVPYLEDGEVVERKEVRIPASGTKTVEFTVTKDSYQCVDASIGPLDPVTICWVPPGITWGT